MNAHVKSSRGDKKTEKAKRESTPPHTCGEWLRILPPLRPSPHLDLDETATDELQPAVSRASEVTRFEQDEHRSGPNRHGVTCDKVGAALMVSSKTSDLSNAQTAARLARARSIVLLCLLAAGMAAPISHAALGRRSAAPVMLAAGDRVVVTGSRLTCAVSTGPGAANPTTIVCGEGNIASPPPGTYAFALADAAALVLKASASGQPVLVVRKKQPTALGRPFPLSTRGASQSVRVAIGGVFVVGGTDVLCVVTKQSGEPAITCGLAASSGTFVVGSYAAVLSKRLVVLSRLLPHDALKTITAVTQPAG